MAETKQTNVSGCCPPKPALSDRELLSSVKAGELTHLFKILANDTRLRLLHALARAGEMCTKDLSDTIKMKPQAVSNQIQRLVDRGIIVGMRNGKNVYYRIADPCVVNLLDQGLCLVEDAEERIKN